ncbi:MAG TPA: carbon-nitrogen hydrolase family protein [Herpetosiphonaceae bacterium]
MPRTVTLAATQMDAAPAPTAERLTRAETLARQAAAAGAELVVLPELFNLGYTYADVFDRAEPPDGPTASWMRRTAADLGVHLAGTLLLLDHQAVYNSLLLFAPDGRVWRYDKGYPWGWERRAFAPGPRAPVVARTDLGRIGLLICWDAAHLGLWRSYTGQVDLMLISACPPDVSNPTYRLAGGATLGLEDLGPAMARVKDSGRQLFGPMVNQQTAWLGVPAVQSVGCGQVRTVVPHGGLALLGLLPQAPGLRRHAHRFGRIELSCALVRGCKIVDQHGATLSELEQADGESWTSASVTIADAPPEPSGAQPPSLLPREAYLSSDVLLPRMMRGVYRRGLRRRLGLRRPPGVRIGAALGAALLAAYAWRRRGR